MEVLLMVQTGSWDCEVATAIADMRRVIKPRGGLPMTPHSGTNATYGSLADRGVHGRVRRQRENDRGIVPRTCCDRGDIGGLLAAFPIIGKRRTADVCQDKNPGRYFGLVSR
jgi:hypothetical protein